MADTSNLPSWANLKGTRPRGMPIIHVNTHEAYPEFLDAYRDLYLEQGRIPNDWVKADGELKKEWAEALDDLASDEPSAYWLECAYQAIKLELQVRCGFDIEIHMKDPGKKFAQAKRAQGRGVEKAAGGLEGGKEARRHFKNLRGFFPG